MFQAFGRLFRRVNESMGLRYNRRMAETRLTLLARVKDSTEGDSWGDFSQIYDGWIRNWLERQGIQPQDIDDICQEVMSIVLREIKNFEHNGRTGALRAWLRNVTSNRLKEFRRKSNKFDGPDFTRLAQQLEDKRSRLTLLWDVEHDRFVLNHLLALVARRLSERSVAAFRKVVIREEPARDVAAELGMTLGAVRVAQHRVLQALKQEGAGLIEC